MIFSLFWFRFEKRKKKNRTTPISLTQNITYITFIKINCQKKYYYYFLSVKKKEEEEEELKNNYYTNTLRLIHPKQLGKSKNDYGCSIKGSTEFG